MSQPSAATRRHRRGIACDECRRRKLRCDGQKPQCGRCLDTGVACELTQRSARGPKKGHLRDLKNRLVYLETLLENSVPAEDTQQDLHAIIEYTGDPSLLPFVRAGHAAEVGTSEPWISAGTVTSNSEHEGLLQPDLTPGVPSFSQRSSVGPIISGHSTPIQSITGLMQDELDQLYLDRVHNSIPILHQRRYMSWSKSSTKTEPRRCLQYAMWTLAALLSTQFRDMIEPLYQETKRMLDQLTVAANEDSNIDTEIGQAWVLLVTFESMRTYHRQAWMSAGSAFRFVQAMHYHELDSLDGKRGSAYAQRDDFIEVEERRRVFWMAYFLDHIISMRGDWPITLNEHVICTRLPASDSKFQNGYRELGPFLSEAMTDSTLQVRSSFTECLILVTICGRSLFQRQQCQISKAYGDMTLDWTEQRQWLDRLLLSRFQVLSQCYPDPTESNDPLLLFTHILAQSTVIYYCKTMIQSDAPSNFTQSREFRYEHRALEASKNIIRLARTLPELPFSKVHPLMPIPLFICAEFLYSNIHNGISVQSPIQDLFHIFRELKNVNDHEQSYLDLLPRSCISKTAVMVGLGDEGVASS
ncbi:transcriptional regulator family: Fungal Specific TF [Aspergillus niger]|nr:transcriptional regulator family: Fungal Specific TF [Aspergillus niger]